MAPIMRPMNTEPLKGKLSRLLEELREHGGNGRSVYAERLHTEIATTRAELGRGTGTPIATREGWSGNLGANGSSPPGW
jgi:hypothetical protein